MDYWDLIHGIFSAIVVTRLLPRFLNSLSCIMINSYEKIRFRKCKPGGQIGV